MTIGAAVTVTVALALAMPPFPVQAIVYVLDVVSAPVVAEPLVGRVPLHAPLAVQLSAFVLLHVKVEELPAVTDVADAENATVGAGVWTTAEP